MKNEFWGYIPLAEEELSEIWENSNIVLDTNILLNLYRYSKPTQEKIIEILEEQKDRFIIPKIVISEFFSNRDEVIQNHLDIKKNIKANINISKIKENINSNRHLNLDSKELIKIIDKFEKKVDEFLETCETNDFFDEDPILEKVSDWFDNKLIDYFNEEELQDIYKEGKIRYDQKIPPGYKDDKKPDDNRRYNDFVIWKHIIKYAGENECDILFISDDLKEDWVKKVNGKKRGPREELLNEFYLKTEGRKIYIYSTEGFLNIYSKYNESERIDDMVIKEVRDIEKETASKFAESKYYHKLRNIKLDKHIDCKEDNIDSSLNNKLIKIEDDIQYIYSLINLIFTKEHLELHIFKNMNLSLDGIKVELNQIKDYYLSFRSVCGNYKNFEKMESIIERLAYSRMKLRELTNLLYSDDDIDFYNKYSIRSIIKEGDSQLTDLYTLAKEIQSNIVPF